MLGLTSHPAHAQMVGALIPATLEELGETGPKAYLLEGLGRRYSLHGFLLSTQQSKETVLVLTVAIRLVEGS